ncbi:reverse transcriptase domain-containing protein [Sphingobacterium sp. LRF_L2]|uniref:reverse transcriptase domain-containing protein n=1 Tax=Sphingobacterium sp. LRF_L2 TaxID=3369421 RepID=UPI003F5FFA95
MFPIEQFIANAKEANRSDEFLDEAKNYIFNLEVEGYPVLFSLVHLSISMGVESDYIRALTSGKNQLVSSDPAYNTNCNSYRETRYKYFKLRKRSNGFRTISAPHKDLKYIQKWIYFNILCKHKLSSSCKGFVPGLSIKDNARVHEGASTILKIDLLKFFDTITEKRVYGVFASMGYLKNLCVTMARLCCCNHREDYWDSYSEQDKEILFDLFKERSAVLPQGAPSSPMLANIIAKRMDERFEKLSVCTSLKSIVRILCDIFTFVESTGLKIPKKARNFFC